MAMALQPQWGRAVAAEEAPGWNQAAEEGEGEPARWPTVDLTEGRAPIGAPPGQFWPAEPPQGPPPGNALRPEPPPGPPSSAGPHERAPGFPAGSASHVSIVSSLQARSLGELTGGAIALGFPFVFAASLVSAFAHLPGEGVRGRLLVAFDYSSFLIAAALLVGMVCLLLLGRSALRTSPSQVPRVQPLKAVIGLALAAESALVALGAIVSFVVYLTLASALPDVVAARTLEELAALPVVAVALFWVWADGTLRHFFGPAASPNGDVERAREPGPPPPPPSPQKAGPA